MSQPINFSEEKYSVWKRLSIFLIDGLTSLITFFIIFFTLGIFSVKSIAYSNIQEMNFISSEIYKRENIDYKPDGQFGIYQIDYDKFIDKEIEKDSDIEKANEKYQETFDKIDKELNENMRYRENYGHFYGIYIATVVSSMLLPLLVFQFLIPLFSKSHQTLTMMMFHVALINTKTGALISGTKLLLRFLFIFTTEFLCVYLILNWIGLIFIVLSSFASISFTKNRSTLHDLVLKVKISPCWYTE